MKQKTINILLELLDKLEDSEEKVLEAGSKINALTTAKKNREMIGEDYKIKINGYTYYAHNISKETYHVILDTLIKECKAQKLLAEAELSLCKKQINNLKDE